MIKLYRKLHRSEDGATLIEFALIAPVMVVVIMGLLDMTYRLYSTAMLQGEVQKAARDSTLESATNPATLTAIDQRVKDGFRQVNGSVTDGNFDITRKNFADFTNAGKMEDTTGPGGVCALGYTYVDRNNSGTWDDGASLGQGGAQDVTVYSVKVTYKSLFPINRIFGGAANQTITASTVLRNQPYNNQQVRNAGVTRACT